MFKNKLLRNLLIGVVLFVGLLILAKQMKWIGGEVTTKVAVELPEKRTIIETVNASGSIYPEVEVKVSSDVSGEVIDLYVEEGDSVQQGQLLAKIKPDIYMSYVDRANAAYNGSLAAIESAKASLEQVKANYTKAKADFERATNLYQDKVISLQDMLAAEATFKNAEAQKTAAMENIKNAEFNASSAAANVKESNENLNKTIISAPMAGVVSKLNIEKGERVVGTSQMTGTEMLRVADFRTLEVRVNVNENDVIKIHLNDTALISVDAYPDRKFKGLVSKIANSSSSSASATDQATTFVVRIKIIPESYADLMTEANKHQPFRPGMNASVEIQTNTVRDAVSIPIQAITLREDSAKAKTEKKADAQIEVVFVYKNGKAEMRRIKTGIQNELFFEIKEGIATTDEVIIAPYTSISRKLKDKMKVEKVEKDKLTDKDE